jgi:hypothetical protein
LNFVSKIFLDTPDFGLHVEEKNFFEISYQQLSQRYQTQSLLKKKNIKMLEKRFKTNPNVTDSKAAKHPSIM